MEPLDKSLMGQIPTFLKNDRDGFAVGKALETGYELLAEQVETVDTILCDAQNMPEWALDRLAAEMGIGWYDYSADISLRRAWMHDALRIKRMEGTKAGMEALLKSVFTDCEVEENWAYGGQPYCFRVTVMGDITAEEWRWAEKAVERMKSLRFLSPFKY